MCEVGEQCDLELVEAVPWGGHQNESDRLTWSKL